MSLAWAVTPDDVATVAEAHNLNPKHFDADEFFGEFVCGCADHIEGVVLQYTDFDDQVEASLSEIEDMMIEEGRVRASEKKYHCP